MRITHPLSLLPLCLAAAVAAQSPERPMSPADRAVVEAATASLSAELNDPAFVAVDEPGDGSIWASARSYKAAFDAEGWRFIGRPAAEAPALSPVAFHLQSVSVGGSALPLAKPARTRDGRRVTYDHGTVVEALDVSGPGVEQSFVFEQLPRRGELVLEVALATSLVGDNAGDGVHLHGPFDDVAYSQAVAIDATGARLTVPTTFAGGRIAIRVPANFVASAALPLTIDPFTSTMTVYSNATPVSVGQPDVAWDETGQLWVVVWTLSFGGNDNDVVVEGIGGNPLNKLTVARYVENTTTSWIVPRIAHLGAADEFLVVAQAQDGVGLSRIMGRCVTNAATMATPQFVIAQSAVDERNPDVGGDPAGAPSFFTVVWEHVTTSADHDIYARQVDSSGALRGAGPTFVATTPQTETLPSISNSDGAPPKSSQRFCIVYQAGSGGARDILGALLTWDGQLVPIGPAGHTFPISVGPEGDVRPSVSSPTLENAAGERLLAAVYDRPSANGGDVFVTCFDGNAVVRASGNLSVLEGLAAAELQQSATVDCDGLRFVVAYSNYTLSTVEAQLAVVTAAGTGLQVEEGPVILRSSGADHDPRIASRYAGSGTHDPTLMVVDDTFDLSRVPMTEIAAGAFDVTSAGRFVRRLTACGGPSIVGLGSAVPGGTFSWVLGPTLQTEGLLLGTPISSTPIPPCPGCMLGVNILLATVGASQAVTVPLDPLVIGAAVSAQGYAFDPSGGCLGQLRFTDTIDVTVE